MSLQYIIDGYNLIHHPAFIRQADKRINDPKKALPGLIRSRRLCGSPKNKIIIVFDGYPHSSSEIEEKGMDIVFSGSESADARIKKIIERVKNPKNIVVVSDDKEIMLYARYQRALAKTVAEFIPPVAQEKEEPQKPELTCSQIDKINQELKKIWLK